MSQWGSSDASSNAVLWAPTSVKLAPTSTNRDNLYGNTTQDAFVSGQKVGLFAVDSTEESVGAGGLATGTVTYAGSGYTANATISLSGGGGSSGVANAYANSTGKINLVKIQTAGSSYETNPSITIAAPANTTFNANTAVTGGTGNGSNNVIALSSAGAFVINDPITYRVATGNTAVTGLTSGTTYYVQFANATVVALSATAGGSRIALTPSTVSETGHALQGATATGTVTVGGAQNKGVPHTGWVLRTEGTGGRAGRVQYEVLVAGGIVSDGSDDTILPDA